VYPELVCMVFMHVRGSTHYAVLRSTLPTLLCTNNLSLYGSPWAVRPLIQVQLTIWHAMCLQVLHAAVILPYVISLGASLAGICSPLLLGCLVLSLPTAQSTLSFARDNHTVPALIAPLKKYATKWHISFGLSLVLGLLLSSTVRV
jgi:hypothetical protein